MFAIQKQTKAMKTLLILTFALSTLMATSISRSNFYDAFESKSKEKMRLVLEDLTESAHSSQQQSYIGAIEMKLSQFERTPKDKALLFKKGRVKLESEIDNNPNNAEYRFLRLAIQENSPKILKYNTNIEEDRELIYSSYNKLDKTLKSIIKRYATNSQELAVEKLK